MKKSMMLIVLCMLVATAPGVLNGIAAESTDAVCVTDILGDTVTLERPARRIVAFFFFEEIFVLGAQNTIVGWSRAYWDGRRQQVWKKYIKESNFPVQRIPDVGYASTGVADCEKIAALNPDVVIAPHRLPDIENKLSRYGIQTVHVDFHSGNNTCRSMAILGSVLGKEEKAQEAVAFYRKQTNRVFSVLKQTRQMKKPKVYLELGTSENSTYGEDYMFGKVIKWANGDNIVSGFGIVKSGVLSAESILEADPDIIIITGAGWAESFDSQSRGPKLGYGATPRAAVDMLKIKCSRPGWDDLTAVKNGKVYGVYHGLSRHIYDFVALQYFAKWFYPELFEDLDPEASWREFHALFLPVSYSGTWAVSIGD